MKRIFPLAWIWTMVVLVICWTPKSVLPVSEDVPRAYLLPHPDKWVHAGIFAVFAFLWMRAWKAPGRIWKILVVGLALALITELGQATWLVQRDADIFDALADAVGVVLGIASAVGLEARNKANQRTSASGESG